MTPLLLVQSFLAMMVLVKTAVARDLLTSPAATTTTNNNSNSNNGPVSMMFPILPLLLVLLLAMVCFLLSCLACRCRAACTCDIGGGGAEENKMPASPHAVQQWPTAQEDDDTDMSHIMAWL